MNRRKLQVFSFFLLLLDNQSLFAQEVVDGVHVDSQLVAETTGVALGGEHWIALRLDHREGWHTYWKNPGDAGLPTEITWDLPEGVTAGDIVWPTPERIVWPPPANLVDFGYTGEVFLLTQLSIPADFQASTLGITADVEWLECKDICIPAGATISLSLPVVPEDQVTIDQRWAEGFAETLSSLPRENIDFDAMFSIIDGDIDLLVQATEAIFESAEEIRFIPGEHRIFDYTDPQDINSQLSSLQLSQAHHPSLTEIPAQISGLIVVTDNSGQETAYEVAAQPQDPDLVAMSGSLGASTPPSPDGNAGMNILTVFAFAMLGGIILNLMPCVFPVLSLKVLSISKNGDTSRQDQRLHGLAYTIGVLLAFLILASVLLALQAGGALIGWGFHLQSSWFVTLLIFLFFIMGLSMSGVIDFGTRIMSMGGDLSGGEGYLGSLFTGILAGIVASPCTAPFMGAALGFALIQPPVIALTVFLALGFGMALPFLLISFNPALFRMLPKPGKWMVTFKQFLAFPLYATAVWLAWVLGNQAGADAMALVLASCVLLAFAAWLYRRRYETNSTFWRYTNAAIILFCLVLVIGVIRSPWVATQDQIQETTAVDVPYEPYNDARLSELRGNGQAVFVNMTADWCITCKVNERVALSSDAFLDALEENNVTYLRGDWTNNDPKITKVLRKYNTSGVPLYLIYPADPDQTAEILPQILTPNIVLDAFERL